MVTMAHCHSIWMGSLSVEVRILASKPPRQPLKPVCQKIHIKRWLPVRIKSICQDYFLSLLKWKKAHFLNIAQKNNSSKLYHIQFWIIVICLLNSQEIKTYGLWKKCDFLTNILTKSVTNFKSRLSKRFSWLIV